MESKPVKHPILVVDDEPGILFSLRGLLRHEFEVHTASSGPEAIIVLEKHPIHIVMSDQRMPEMTGVEFLRRIKIDHPEAIRVIFTGYADIHAVIDAINKGNVFRYVTKPWDPDDLFGVLREAGRQYDQIVGRNRLLADLNQYAVRCDSFEAGMRAGELGSLTPAGVVEVEGLLRTGRELLDRLDQAFAVMKPREQGNG
jgi:DNA-binding NtrC family response regulator